MVDILISFVFDISLFQQNGSFMSLLVGIRPLTEHTKTAVF